MIEQCIKISNMYPDNLKVGNVEFDKIEFKGGRLNAYLEDAYLSEKFPIARLKRNGNTWMSITPMELESHITHISEATGDVLVGGLGMGYYITQIVSKSDVRSVIVIEKDPEVVEAYKALIKTNPMYFSNDKVHIIQGDLFNVLPTLKETVFNYTYLDIWLDMCFDTIANDFEKINDLDGINTHRVGFWGMEKFVFNCLQEYQHYYLPAELCEILKDELVNKFGEVVEWCHDLSIDLITQLQEDE